MLKLPDCAKLLRDTLAPLGFKRKSSTWRREMHDFIDVIEFLREKYQPNFRVSIGVLTKSVREKAWGTQVPPWPDIADCTVQRYLARDPLGAQSSWPIDQASLMEVSELVVTSGLPFLEDMHSRERQIRFFRDGGLASDWISPIYEAILMFECGAQEDACLKLRKLKSRYGNDSLQERTAEIRARLNCPKD